MELRTTMDNINRQTLNKFMSELGHRIKTKLKFKFTISQRSCYQPLFDKVLKQLLVTTPFVLSISVVGGNIVYISVSEVSSLIYPSCENIY